MAEPPQVAVVTGGARGIGAAIAGTVVRDGGRVLVADLDEEAGRVLEGRLGSSARFLRADVTAEQDVRALFAHAERELGPVDAVYANAGAVGVIGTLAETAAEDFRSTLDLLVGSVFVTFKHAVATMRDRGRGAMVATASVASLRGGLGPHAYTAAKHAVKGLVESVAVEVAPYGLTVNAVAPGGTVSSLSAGLIGASPDDLRTAYEQLAARSSSGVPTTSEDVAEAAYFLSRARRVNGATLVVDGGDAVLGTAGRAYYS
ncbi:SDR family NAD(P)-dependent oxidoreductase [uncultured Aeromicrobium sp.]|uniref:SDR family NAD(P)-dependent oxidoreductase n=1 Tax=uncultured Aeromicrobium sp. TaxID=337820 RepID=UPI0025FF0E9F|nr:SDR family oxidoreductase [uncultured Aeromicrobium sp.]